MLSNPAFDAVLQQLSDGFLSTEELKLTLDSHPELAVVRLLCIIFCRFSLARRYMLVPGRFGFLGDTARHSH